MGYMIRQIAADRTLCAELTVDIVVGKRFVLYGVLLNALETVNYMDSGLAYENRGIVC